MTVSALIQGSIAFGAPQQRTSRNGNSFVTFNMKVANGTESAIWRVFVFSESAQAEVLRLGEGDGLACQGTPKFELYQPEGGAARVSLSLTADHVLALRQPPRERKKKDAPASMAASPPPQRAPERGGFKSRCGAATAGLDDEIPF